MFGLRALGTFWRPRPIPEAATAPPVEAAAILRLARRLRFQVPAWALDDLAGSYQAARRGTGLAFSELRPYEPGDDVRHIDWKVTARQNRPYVRHYAQERSQTLWLLVDLGPSMRFGAPGRSKADRAVQAAALLGAAALQAGDRAALVAQPGRPETGLDPGHGPRHLSRLLRALVVSGPGGTPEPLAGRLPQAALGRRRGLVVVLSDFAADEPLAPWREAARRGDLLALRVVHPLERQLPAAGLLDLAEIGTGRRLAVDSENAAARAAYADAAEARQAAFRRWAAQVAIACDEVPCEVDPAHTLLRILRQRTRPGIRRR